jgi:hypothetical protein
MFRKQDNFRAQISESFLYCFSYLFSYSLILMLVISVAIFFQFQLGYEMTAMDSWLFEHGWEMNAFVSVLNLTILSKFLFLKSDDRFPLRSLLINEIRRPPKKVIVILFAILLSYAILLRLEFNPELTSVDHTKVLLSYILSSVCLGTHFLFVASLQAYLPLSYWWSCVRVLLLSVGLYFVIQVMFPQAQSLTVVHVYLFFLLLHSIVLRLKVSDLVFLSLFCFSPILVFTGFDPLLGEKYSPWVYTGHQDTVFFISLGLICTVYVGYPLLKNKR